MPLWPFNSVDRSGLLEEINRGQDALEGTLSEIEQGVQRPDREAIHDHVDEACRYLDDLPVNRPPALNINADAEPSTRVERLLVIFSALEDRLEDGNTKGFDAEALAGLTEAAAQLAEYAESELLPWPYHFHEEGTETTGGKRVRSTGSTPNNNESVFAGPYARKMMEVHRHDNDRPLWVGVGTRTGKPAGIDKDQLFKHAVIYGRTGYGKSTLLQNMCKQLAESDAGICFFDPNGDDSEELMEKLPPKRLDDVIWIEPGSNRSHVSGFNFLDVGVDEDEPHYDTAIEGLVDDLVKMLGADDYWGPRMDRVAQNIIRAMARSQYDFNIVDMYFLLASEESRYRFAEIVGQECSEFIETFTSQIAQMEQDDLEPLLGRFQQWVENPLARRLIGFRDSNFNIAEAVESNKIIIVRMSNEPKDLKKMVGKAVLRRIWATVRARSVQRQHEREPFYLIADEFDNIASSDESIPTMLSEARKYRLSITACTQYPGSLPGNVAEALNVNTDSKLTFNPGSSKQARPVADELALDTETLLQESNYHIWMQLTLSETNQVSEAFRVYTLPPYPPLRSYEKAQSIIDAKLAEYGRELEDNNNIGGDLLFNFGRGLLEESTSISTEDIDPSNPDVSSGSAGGQSQSWKGESSNGSTDQRQNGQTQNSQRSRDQSSASSTTDTSQARGNGHVSQSPATRQEYNQATDDGQTAEQDGKPESSGTVRSQDALANVSSVHDLDDAVIDDVLSAIYATQIIAARPLPLDGVDDIGVVYRNSADDLEMIDPMNTLVPKSAVIEKIEERLGDTGYISKLGNVFELLMGKYVTSSRRKGEEYLALTNSGFSRIIPDSGEGGNSGGSEHRYFLRKAFSTFTRLGYEVSIPTQEGDEIADAMARPPFDPTEITGKKINSRLKEIERDHPLLFEFTRLDTGFIEAETTTPKKPAQFLNNLKKAVNSGNTCIFVCKDGSADKDNFSFWGEKCEKIAYPTEGNGRGKQVATYEKTAPVRQQDGDTMVFYNRNQYLRYPSSAYAPVWPATYGSQQWMYREGSIVLADCDEGREYTQFTSPQAYADADATDYTAYYTTVEGEHIVISHQHFEPEDGTPLKDVKLQHFIPEETSVDDVYGWTYEKKAQLKNDWKKVVQPFISQLQYDEWPKPDDFEIIIYPDDDNDEYDQPQLFRRGKCLPLFDTLAEEAGIGEPATEDSGATEGGGSSGFTEPPTDQTDRRVTTEDKNSHDSIESPPVDRSSSDTEQAAENGVEGDDPDDTTTGDNDDRDDQQGGDDNSPDQDPDHSETVTDDAQNNTTRQSDPSDLLK